MLQTAQSLLSQLTAAQKRDSAQIDSLVSLTHIAHNDALACKTEPQAHLAAMMLLAASSSAQKLLSAPNVIMFRLGVRDIQLFLTEARRYWQGVKQEAK
jgi:hypothetical protein